MKALWCFVVAICLASATALAVSAKMPEPVVGTVYQLDVQILRVPAGNSGLTHARVAESEEWNRHLHSGEIQLLESGSIGAMAVEHPTPRIMIGNKVPIPYADPRTGNYQVQYVDVGFKFDFQVAELANGLIRLDCTVERATAGPKVAALLPASEAMRTVSAIQMRPGQVAVLAATRGLHVVTFVKHAYANVKFSDNDTLLLAVSVRKP